jgi:mannitol 2-dehydrogenase
MADPDIGAFFRKVEREEIVPYVDAVPGMTPAAYAELIERRFSNPAIRDTARRVAFDGSSRHTGFILPVLRDALAAGASIDGLALTEALWARMCAGVREDGSEIAPNDPVWDTLRAAAEAARTRPAAWLEQHKIYGDIARDERFAAAFGAWFSGLWSSGTRAMLRQYAQAGRA